MSSFSSPSWAAPGDGIDLRPEPLDGRPWPPPGVQGEFVRPLTLGEVLDGMFRLLLSRLRAYALVLGVVLVPLYLVTVWAQRDAMGGRGLIDMFSNPEAFQAASTGGSGAQFLAALLSFFAWPYLTGAALAVAFAAMVGGEPDPATGGRSALQRYLALLGYFLLVTLLLSVAALVPAVLAAVLVASVGPLGGALAGLVLLAAIVAVGTLISLGTPAIVAERLGPVAGLRRSFQLARGSFWSLLGRLIVVVIVAVVVLGILNLVIGIPAGLFSGVIGYVLQVVGSLILGIPSTALFANALALLYVDARVRQEGLDLEARAADMTGAQQGWAGEAAPGGDPGVGPGGDPGAGFPGMPGAPSSDPRGETFPG